MEPPAWLRGRPGRRVTKNAFDLMEEADEGEPRWPMMIGMTEGTKLRRFKVDDGTAVFTVIKTFLSVSQIGWSGKKT
jgi:hypothetical protein